VPTSTAPAAIAVEKPVAMPGNPVTTASYVAPVAQPVSATRPAGGAARDPFFANTAR
jgi:hypothetical protein